MRIPVFTPFGGLRAARAGSVYSPKCPAGPPLGEHFQNDGENEHGGETCWNGQPVKEPDFREFHMAVAQRILSLASICRAKIVQVQIELCPLWRSDLR